MSLNTNTQLTTTTTDFYKLEKVANPIELAAQFARSGFFSGIKDPSQALVKIIAGQEFGLGPVAAMSGLHIVEGKPTLSSGTVSALIKKSGKYNYKVIQSDDKKCNLEFFENWSNKWESLGSSEFTIEDAAKAGLSSKANWQKYTSDMLFARAITRGARRFCPDVFSGPIYTPEELRESPDFTPVKVEPVDVSKQYITNKQIAELQKLINEAAELSGIPNDQLCAQVLNLYTIEKIQELYEPYATQCIEYWQKKVEAGRAKVSTSTDEVNEQEVKPVVTQKQLARLHVMLTNYAAALKIAKQEAEAKFKEVFNLNSWKDITIEQYNEITNLLEDTAKTADAVVNADQVEAPNVD